MALQRTARSLFASLPRRATIAAGAALLVAAQTMPATLAQGTVTAHYTLKVARITIGNADITAAIGAERYTAVASGRASGFLRILLSGEGRVSARGAIGEERLIPDAVAASVKDEDESSEVSMTLEHGNVKDLTAENSAPEKERVPVTADHRRGITDPLSALLVPAGNGGLGPQACQRTLHIFDGRRRYDLKLAFKRVDAVKTTAGDQSPVLVCAVVFKAIAGHRVDSALVSYLSEGRDIELWLMPITGTHVLAPFRLSINNMLGNMVLEATRFETTPTAPAAPPNGRSAL